MVSYQEMKKITLERAKNAGLSPGVKVDYKKRTGVVADVNPFFFDMNPLRIIVHLDAYGKYKAKRHVLISVEELTIK
jgi:hypothetical protein